MTVRVRIEQSGTFTTGLVNLSFQCGPGRTYDWLVWLEQDQQTT